jgi:hypothetical protein
MGPISLVFGRLVMRRPLRTRSTQRDLRLAQRWSGQTKAVLTLPVAN